MWPYSVGQHCFVYVFILLWYININKKRLHYICYSCKMNNPSFKGWYRTVYAAGRKSLWSQVLLSRPSMNISTPCYALVCACVQSLQSDDWHVVPTAQDGCLTSYSLLIPVYWFFFVFFSMTRFLWKALFEIKARLFVCFSVIMASLFDNAAEGSHCTTFSHENSFPLLLPSLSLSPLPPSGHPYKTVSFVPIDPLCQYFNGQYKVWEERNWFECKSTHCSRKSCSVQCELVFTNDFFFFCHRANGV